MGDGQLEQRATEPIRTEMASMLELAAGPPRPAAEQRDALNASVRREVVAAALRALGEPAPAPRRG